MEDKVTISGTALLATIATMDSLGPIGREVLREHWIKKIHNKINTNNAIVKESSLDKRLLKIEKNIDLLMKKLNQTNKRKI